MITVVRPENLVPGDIVISVDEVDSCCGHLVFDVTVSRSPCSEES